MTAEGRGLRAFEKTTTRIEELLNQPIRDLGLKVKGSPLERFVRQLYRELENKGIKRFKPQCYLSSEWGCPSEEPVIAIPFYLANPELAQLEKEMDHLEDEREIMMYLRHEAGHAFNYAYKLYETSDWRELFGPFRRPYREDYRPVPFSRRYVRHIAGWYAQKHPDEDFAETFAVWLTPRTRWRERYRGWGAMAKLRYVDRTARRLGSRRPVRVRGDKDEPVEEIDATVADFYREAVAGQKLSVELPLDNDLGDIFKVSKRRKRGVRPAVDLLRENRKAVIDKVTYWTGVQRPLVKNVMRSIEAKVRELGLFTDVATESEHLVEVTAYATTLAMNYLTRGKFVQP